jgi:hypothetical protein
VGGDARARWRALALGPMPARGWSGDAVRRLTGRAVPAVRSPVTDGERVAREEACCACDRLELVHDPDPEACRLLGLCGAMEPVGKLCACKRLVAETAVGGATGTATCAGVAVPLTCAGVGLDGRGRCPLGKWPA